MVGGYTGKILNIDLKNQTTKIEKTDLNDASSFIGAKGLGAKILFDRLPKKTDPLSPKNILMFTTGPLTGTSTQTSGRGTVVTKSPKTGLFLDSHFGGFFAAEIKKAGWDVIIISDKSEKPVYLKINNDVVEFKDAKDLWGKECLETHEILQKKEGKVKTAVIGPAGENLVKFSSITIDGHRHAGRGGSGAVMGSKNLKAIALTGSNKIPLHDPDGFNKKTKEVLKRIQENDFIPIRRKFGTPYWVKVVNDEGFIPTRNFTEGEFEYGDEINAETMQKKIVDAGGACFNCVIACWNKSSIKNGPYKGVSLVGPEYETIALMGSNLGMASIEDLAYITNICNELGMDTISLGGVLGFAIEAYKKGVITKKDLEGIELDWGKTDEIAKLIKVIAYKKTKLGGILTEGVNIAAEKLGKNSENFSVHIKGLEVPGYDPRGTFGMAIAYATSDRGACHQRAWTVKAELKDPNLNRFSFKDKAKIVKEVQDERAAFFSLVLCDFAPISEENCVEMWNLATGFNHTVESYLKAGERIWNLIRLFNLREGMDPKTDTLPVRFFKESFTKGRSKGIFIKKQEFEKSLKEYYTLRGWNEKGIPTSEKLKELGLSKYEKMID
ncbi:MAG: aldehyde ferredoxin oxidoreductase family protein [Candidatus Thermoplasmatota archaeon]|jgi:aldehyde:ferredoxin oxidoreductase|nr:aldehyde ferredoxin oxidoreductase family protein [Candidatus Thermoplasmatota archaeon]